MPGQPTPMLPALVVDNLFSSSANVSISMTLVEEMWEAQLPPNGASHHDVVKTSSGYFAEAHHSLETA